MRLFLDTNILVDFYARRDPFFREVKLLWIASYFKDVELWASSQSFADAEYILRRAIPVRTLREMMAKSLAHLRISSPGPNDLADGLSSDWPDLEDFLIARCAQSEGADYLITRDAEGFESSKVPALSPEQFFMVMQEEYGVVYNEETL